MPEYSCCQMRLPTLEPSFLTGDCVAAVDPDVPVAPFVPFAEPDDPDVTHFYRLKPLIDPTFRIAFGTVKIRAAKYRLFGIGYFVKPLASNLRQPHFERLCFRRRNRHVEIYRHICQISGSQSELRL